MRIESIKAEAFGPLCGEALEFSQGMNVVHGPNESGKSSWHAAIYVGLCGMRRTKGKPTLAQQALTERYLPWRGGSWKVTERIVLDSGRVIEFEHILGRGGRSVATDLHSKRSLTGELLRPDGAVDGAALLGLTGETALATLFVRQAEVLRVLADAGELQKFLQRAAATSSVDTTAQEALDRIVNYKRERVGLVQANSRGPLATATARREKARLALEVAEELHETYQEQVERRRRAETALAQAEEQLERLQRHEAERQLREQWLVIRDAQRRLHQARQLARQLSAGPHDSGSRDLVTAVTRALALFDSRPPAPVELEGPSTEELEAELAAIPQWPTGDLEPAECVMVSFHACRQAAERLRAHSENEPMMSAADELPTTVAELRHLAEELEAPLPQVDRAFDTSVPARPEAVPPGRRTSPPLPVGVVLAVAGAILAVMVQPALGGVFLLGGLLLCALSAVSRNAASAPRGDGTPRVNANEAARSAGIARIEARQVLQEEARALGEQRRQAARARAAELGLPVHPDQLRQLATANEMNASAQAQIVGWERRKTELKHSLSIQAQQLRSTLASRGVALEGNERLDQAFHRYAEDCRKRSQAAREAARAADLRARIALRQAAEAAREEDRAARARAVRMLHEVGSKTGCQGRTDPELADALRRWLADETELDERRRATGQTSARLDQLLDGRTMADLEMEIEALTAKAGGPPPAEEAMALADHSAELEVLGERVAALREQVAQLSGQLGSAERHLSDVSQAIEEDAWAEAELRSLTSLGEDLDCAAAILGAAKERVHGDIAPVLNETIRPWVPRTTQGRYDDVRVDPATLELEVHEVGGRFRPARLLSQGTSEQLFLLLRLSLAKHLATTGESAPLILDDVTVQSDAGRTTAVLDLLWELSQDHQVVLFTQEDEVRLWAAERLVEPSGRLIQLASLPGQPVGHQRPPPRLRCRDGQRGTSASERAELSIPDSFLVSSSPFFYGGGGCK